jgi:hypothetical protein
MTLNLGRNPLSARLHFRLFLPPPKTLRTPYRLRRLLFSWRCGVRRFAVPAQKASSAEVCKARCDGKENSQRLPNVEEGAG